MILEQQMREQAQQLVLSAAQITNSPSEAIALALSVVQSLGNTSAPSSAPYVNGLSAPDEHGLVKIQALDVFRAEIQASDLPQHVKKNVLADIGTRYACVPGLKLLQESDPRYWMVSTETAHATMRSWLSGPEQVLVNRYYVADPNAVLPRDRVHRLPNDYIEGGVALPRELDTVDKCVADVKRVAAQIIKDHRMHIPSTVDFSPSKP
jgi:hypothetical protein